MNHSQQSHSQETQHEHQHDDPSSAIRQQIRELFARTDLTAAEKSIRIQQLMSKKENVPLPIQRKVNWAEYRQPLNDELEMIWHSHDRPGCVHYQRHCKIYAACCDGWFGCRRCHDEAAQKSVAAREKCSLDGTLDRTLLRFMLCMHCREPQPIGQFCSNCPQEVTDEAKEEVDEPHSSASGLVTGNRRMARYFCKVCNLFDDNPKHEIYHCDACGICRVGRGLGIDYFHCDKCKACLAIEMQKGHRCIERTLDSDCPICGEYLFTSTQKVTFMKPCNHSIHERCYKAHTATSYQCPICCKSLGDMSAYFRELDALVESQRMPAEHANWRSFISCVDCERRCWRPFHYLYHRCDYCKSYNTAVLETRKDGEGEVLVTEELPEDTLTDVLGETESSSSLLGDSSDDESQSSSSDDDIEDSDTGAVHQRSVREQRRVERIVNQIDTAELGDSDDSETWFTE